MRTAGVSLFYLRYIQKIYYCIFKDNIKKNYMHFQMFNYCFEYMIYD